MQTTFITVLKIVTSVISMVWFSLLVLGVTLPALNNLANGARFPAWYTYTLIFPMIYLPYCVVASTKLLSGRTLLISGIVMHLALILWIVVAVANNRYSNVDTIFLIIG